MCPKKEEADKKLVRWYKPHANKMLKAHPGATKSMVKTKDKLRKAGARDTKEWSRRCVARQGAAVGPRASVMSRAGRALVTRHRDIWAGLRK